MSARTELTYLVPLRRSAAAADDDLPPYLATIVPLVAEVLVVDGSPDSVAAGHRRAWPRGVRGLRIAPPAPGRNGKVEAVRAGMDAARTPCVVIADDDVRYDEASLMAVARALRSADVVRPQNYFAPLCWHALLDEGRSLIARATGGDWPGTLGVRRTAYRRAGGYAPDVLFENLELVRTIRAAGGRERRLDDVFVRRRPPSLRHYAGQRVRQAYDEFARPLRLGIELTLGPLTLTLAARYGARGLALPALAAVALAEAGRRKDGAAAVFPPAASLLAPVWLAERAVASWLAVGARLRGGVRYGGGRIVRAATPARVLRRRSAAAR